jgi:hypothetical protein
MSDELVSVMVPRRHLGQVYGLIARLDGVMAETAWTIEPAVPAAQGNGVPATEVSDEWTPKRLKRMVEVVEESPPAMIDILSALASRPDEWLSMRELARSIRGNKDATWNTVAGTLGAFGNRVANRYRLKTWPFDNRYDHKAGGRVCRMSEARALEIKQMIADRKK